MKITARWLKIFGLCCGLYCGLWSSQAIALSEWNGVLRIGLESDIRSTNPGVNRDSNTDTVLHHIVESLVAYREDLSIAPLLAKEIIVSDDGLSITFRLRDDVLFHNGKPLTAEIVKWNWMRFLDPKTKWRCKSWYDGTHALGVRITEIDVVDEKTIAFSLERPSVSFLHMMANVQCITSIVHPDSVTHNGEWIKPIGTGPYELLTWKHGEYIELLKFHSYRSSAGPSDGFVGSKMAHAEKLRFLIIPEASVAKSALLAGDIDILPKLPVMLYSELEKNAAFNLHIQQLLNWVVLLIQTDDPVFKDVRLRQALVYAVDRDKLTKYSTYGFGLSNGSAIPDVNPYYSKQQTLNQLNYNPERARELLKEAQYAGQPITIQTNKKHQHIFDNAIIIHAMLRRVGFNVHLEVLDWASQLNNYFSGDFQLSSFDYTARTEPYLNYFTFTGPKELAPTYQWSDSEAIDLLRRSEQESDPKDRKKIFDQLDKKMQLDVPIMGLYNEQALSVSSAKVVGYTTWIVGKPRFWGVRIVSE